MIKKKELGMIGSIGVLCIATLFFFLALEKKGVANEIDFEAAINKYASQYEPYISLGRRGFDSLLHDAGEIEAYKRGKPSQGFVPAKEIALEKVGLLKAKEIEIEASNASKKNPKKTTTKKIMYELTDLGKQYYVEIKMHSIVLKGFRYGEMTVDRIIKWKGPIDFKEYKQWSVYYTYKIKNIADWAQDKDVQKAFPDIKRELDGVRKETKHQTVNLTSSGWEVDI